MAQAPHGRARRRIDRITAPDFLDGVERRPVVELRALRDDCREEEAQLSFARRVLQGRLDIVRAVVAQRSGANAPSSGEGTLLEGLPDILADERRPSAIGDAHVAPVREAPVSTDGRRAADALLLDASIGRLPDLPDDELLLLVDRLSAEERRISDLRRTVLDALDALQAELVRRYAADASVVSDAVADAVATTTAPRAE